MLYRLPEELIQAGVVVLNTYRSAQALTVIGKMNLIQGKVTPRSPFEVDLGRPLFS